MELVQLVEHIAKTVYPQILDEEGRKHINIWVKMRTLEGEKPTCLCGEKFEGEMVYKHILEDCGMDVMTSVSLEDEGHKRKEKKRETKSEKRKRKNERKKQMSNSDSHTDAPKESTPKEESSNGIADTGCKSSEVGDGQDDDIPKKEGPSQESLNRSEKTIRAVEEIFRRASIQKGQTE